MSLVNVLYEKDPVRDDKHIRVKIQCSDLAAFYIVNTTTRLRKTLQRFCKSFDKDIQTHAFSYMEKVINSKDTPKSLGMGEGDEIICWELSDRMRRGDEPSPSPSTIIMKEVNRAQGGEGEKCISFIIRNCSLMNCKVTMPPKRPFSEVFEIYCEMHKKGVNKLRFFFQGEKVKSLETPHSLDVEEGDIVDCHHAQYGGM